MIKNNFSSFQGRIAAGMVGEGSECLRFDDVFSRDHDWGPGFCLWLTDEDFDEFGPALQDAYEKLPRVFMGFERKIARLSNQKLGVFRIFEFYKRFTGLPSAPKTPGQWINLCDAYLCACTSGEVFYDPFGKFSGIRKKLLEFYPEDVRRFKIAAKCMLCAQSGQYNAIRSAKRGEPVAVAFARNEFCMGIMDLVFLLKKRFAPFYKWKHRAVKDLGPLGRHIHSAVAKVVSCHNDLEAQDLMESMCFIIIDELKLQNLSQATGNFLLDHGLFVQQSILDEILRQKDVWGGC
jgi:hypothetical protein